MTAARFLDQLAELHAWIEPPSEHAPRWRIFEGRKTLARELRDAICEHWADVKAGSLQRQRESFEKARAAARECLLRAPDAMDQERAID